MNVPYASAISDMRAREEVKKVLRGFGCESVGFMDDYDRHEIILHFTHRGRAVQLRASAKGWAQMWLKQNPWTSRHRMSRVEHGQAALRQGQVAVNSILRDWIKGQITAIETGILSFEAVFALHADGGRQASDRASRRNKTVARTGAAEGGVTGEGLADDIFELIEEAVKAVMTWLMSDWQALAFLAAVAAMVAAGVLIMLPWQ